MLHCRSLATSDTIHFRANRLATVETKSNQICPLDCKYLIKMDLVLNLQSFSACECNEDCGIEVPDIKCGELWTKLKIHAIKWMNNHFLLISKCIFFLISGPKVATFFFIYSQLQLKSTLKDKNIMTVWSDRIVIGCVNVF